jgi:hypothetical protein
MDSHMPGQEPDDRVEVESSEFADLRLDQSLPGRQFRAEHQCFPANDRIFPPITTRILQHCQVFSENSGKWQLPRRHAR